MKTRFFRRLLVAVAGACFLLAGLSLWISGDADAQTAAYYNSSGQLLLTGFNDSFHQTFLVNLDTGELSPGPLQYGSSILSYGTEFDASFAFYLFDYQFNMYTELLIVLDRHP